MQCGPSYPTSPVPVDILLRGGGGAGVDELGVVVDDTLDKALLLEVGDRAASKRAVDLHAVDKDRLRDDLVGRDLLHDAVAACQRQSREARLMGEVETGEHRSGPWTYKQHVQSPTTFPSPIQAREDTH